VAAGVHSSLARLARAVLTFEHGTHSVSPLSGSSAAPPSSSSILWSAIKRTPWPCAPHLTQANPSLLRTASRQLRCASLW